MLNRTSKIAAFLNEHTIYGIRHKLSVRIYPGRVALKGRDLAKSVSRFFSFFLVFLFAFSLLSNCYCLPAFASEHSAQPAGMQSEMPAHCDHHADKSKDCAPRYNTNSFEVNTFSLDKVFTPQSCISNLCIDFFERMVGKESVSNQVGLLLPNASPPEFYLLQHSFLI